MGGEQVAGTGPVISQRFGERKIIHVSHCELVRLDEDVEAQPELGRV